MGVRPKATTRRMLNLIGLGLHDEKDITVNGLAAVRRSERVYLEAYTSILGVPKDRLDAFYGKECIVADRDMVETMSDEILQDADKLDVSFLVVGDPFGATTHSDLLLRADERGVPVRVFHNASVMNAAGAAGLALYNYGQAVSVPFFTDSWRPSSWVPRILENSRLGLHTLCLLDIKVKEQSEENLARYAPDLDAPTTTVRLTEGRVGDARSTSRHVTCRSRQRSSNCSRCCQKLSKTWRGYRQPHDCRQTTRSRSVSAESGNHRSSSAPAHSPSSPR